MWSEFYLDGNFSPCQTSVTDGIVLKQKVQEQAS